MKISLRYVLLKVRVKYGGMLFVCGCAYELCFSAERCTFVSGTF